MPSNLIQTKLLVPPTRPTWVPRPHLIDQLNAGLEHNLILVSAPAGYGKSTLLSEWAHQVTLPVAWLTLEKGDNAASRFWAYFASALQTIPSLKTHRIGEELKDLENVSPPFSQEDALTRLVSKIAQVQEPFILVLDDLHLITDPAIHDGLVFLLEHLPPPPGAMHLVIASRMDPPWPLARMRARAQTVELRTRDLRFTPDEAAQFLNQTMGLSLSVSDIAQLDQRTEGWIAGLQMAALSMQKRDDIPSFIEGFSGSHRFILDYLIEEVLNQQPPGMIDFLLRTSILEKLSAPLCDVVTDTTGSHELLSRLEQSNVFLASIDDEQHWYRYHHLFGDLLRKRLLTTHGEEVPGLHSRASKWFESNGYLREAILHALDAEDMKQVARLVSGNILILAEGEALPALLERFQSTHKEDICSHPWLCISLAWAKAYAGQLDEAEACIDKIESALDKKVTGEDRAHLIGHGMTIRAYVLWIKGRPQLAVDVLRKALTRIPVDDAQERANILVIMGLALQNAENNSAAIQAFKDAMSFSLKADNRYLYIYASSCLAYVLKGIGQLHEAFEISQETIKYADQSDEEYFVLAVGLAARGEILKLRNDLQGSLRSAQQAVALAEKWKQADTLHYSLSVLTDTYLALGCYKEAEAVIQRSKWIARNVSEWFMEITEFQEAKLNLAYENWDQFLQWRQRRCIPGKLWISYYPAIVMYLMIHKDYPEALKLLDEGISRLEESGYWGRTIELYLMRAVVYSALGKKEKAMASLAVGLKMGEPEGYVFLFVIQGKPMEKLLRQAVKAGMHKEFAQKVLDAMAEKSSHNKGVESKARGKKPAKEQVPAEPLSERELEVLRLLTSHLTVPEIAQELTVAPSTVRSHVRVIYNKLGAHGRIEAIQKARDLGLI